MLIMTMFGPVYVTMDRNNPGYVYVRSVNNFNETTELDNYVDEDFHPGSFWKFGFSFNTKDPEADLAYMNLLNQLLIRSINTTPNFFLEMGSENYADIIDVLESKATLDWLEATNQVVIPGDLKEEGTTEEWDDIENSVDSLYAKAVNLVKGQGYCSISFLKKNLKIGSERAKEIINEMVSNKVVGDKLPGNKGREVLF